MAPPSSPPENSRPRLLYNFGAAFLAIAHIAFHRTEQLNNPLGLVTRILVFVAAPFICPVERHWLSMLFFFDNRILAIEDIAVSLFPQTEKMFLVLDQLAILVESLPKLVDDVIDHLLLSKPAVKTTARDWEWSPEKDIAVDIKCNKEDAEAKKIVGDKEDEIKEVKEPTMCVEKGSEKKVREGEEKKVREGEVEAEEELEDPILALFDAGWGWK